MYENPTDVDFLFSLLQGRSHCKQALVERSTHLLLLLIFFFFFQTGLPHLRHCHARAARVVVHDVTVGAVRRFGLRTALLPRIFRNSLNFCPNWTYDTSKWGRIRRWFQIWRKFWNSTTFYLTNFPHSSYQIPLLAPQMPLPIRKRLDFWS